MFMQNPGTKELIDALIMCRRIFHHMRCQPLPEKTNYFEDTRMMGDYLQRLIDAAESNQERKQNDANRLTSLA